MSEELLRFCYKGNFDKLKILLANKDDSTNINYQDQFGKNGLMLACANGHLEIVQYLLSSDELTKKANIHDKNKDGLNCLMVASGNGHLEIVQYLLTSDDLIEHSRINHTSRNNDSVLIWAARTGHLEIVDYLLTSKDLKEHANLYQKNKNGWDALTYASYYNYYDVVEYLIMKQNFQIDKITMNWLIEKNKLQILSLIQSRDLYQKINDNLAMNDQIIKHRKI